MDLEALERAIRQCTRCRLHKYRRNAVPGEGSIKLGVMIVGEAPGATEDEEGRPFVGAAGALLTEAMSLNGVSRNDVYITNVVKCRPPGNRTPHSAEINACLPYLLAQISILKPKRIIALGAVSAKTLLRLIGVKFEKMETIRGKCFRGKIAGIDVEICAMYHPAAVLRNPALREIFHKDLEEFLRAKLI